MNEGQAAPTAVSEEDTARTEGRVGSTPVVPPPPRVASWTWRWTVGRITALVVGGLLGLVSLVLLGSGGTVVWAAITQRDGAGYVTSDAHEFSTAGSALVTISADLGSPGIGWLYAPSLLDQVRIRVTPTTAGSTLFVGIGPTDDVDRYLAGVGYTLISDFWTESVQPVGHGGSLGSAPTTQDFWVASDTGQGSRTLTWEPTGGSWTVVVMNADGRPGVDVRADLAATIPKLVGIGIGLLIAGGIFLIGAVLLIVGAVRRGDREAEKAPGA